MAKACKACISRHLYMKIYVRILLGKAVWNNGLS